MSIVEEQEAPQIEVFNLDLDEEVLSHLAIQESVYAFRAERVRNVLLEDDGVREIFDWQMAHVREHTRPATASVLAEEFDLSFEDPLTAVGDLIERLRDRYITNHVREEMEKVVAAYKQDPGTVAHVMVRVGRDLSALVTPQGESYGTGDVDRVMEEYDKRTLAGIGPSMGFPEIDDYFYGMRGVVMNIGPPKSMKSWIAVKAFLKNIVQGRCAWHYSLELPAEETNERLYALAANISPWKFIKGGLTREDRNLLYEVAEVLDEQGQYRIVKPPEGERDITTLVGRARDAGAEVVFIDQLQYLEYKGESLYGGDTKDYGKVLNTARNLSDEGPLWITHQFNRTTMFAESMPSMQQAKGSAACEEVSSLILGLWANKDMRKSGIMEMGSIASRHFMDQSWEIAVDMNRGCQFECVGVMEHDEEGE